MTRPSGPSEHDAALLQDTEAGAEQRLGGNGAHQHEHPRRERRELGRQPRAARDGLRARRLLVQAARAASLPPEVLDRVREVHAPAVDARRLHAVVEHAPGGSDERMPLRVLVIAGLLADQDELGIGGALAEHDLRALLPEIAAPAARGRATQMLEVAVVGQELLGSLVSAHSNKR